ncbi:SAM-dependent methyltransferase [Kibdelosporangium philippinense]|uniref:SAM-dependent methyltransferase n=1 Tax=Kibdelosporangium philippinense TaxID=211113 RepID=A0ABS8ZRK5_9PSEU|nr:SAM-dependent methyltransferase [Kibdelosporangium philippinense]MCE7010237.1 SAM-dependent methyltransferase [Kibdelosporangium philippinense]
MIEENAWIPDGVDQGLPSAARVYDFLLGGAHNFAIDRMVGEKVLAVQSNGRQIAGSNRAFMGRAVRYMIDQGITQFLDLGSGIPTAGNVHEVAQRANPDSRVVYVDYDEVAVSHSALILAGNDNATVVRGDLCEPSEVLETPEVGRLLDFKKPIGLLMVAVFHFVADERDPAAIVARYRDALAPGSLFALSHLTADHAPEAMAGVVEAMRNSRDPMYFRPYNEVAALFDGFELVEPGVVSAPLWRPDSGIQEPVEGVYAGVARK